MSADSLYFFDQIGGYSQRYSVCSLLEDSLSQIVEQYTRESQSHGCLLADMGDFLVTVMAITSEIAQHLVKGNHIIKYTSDRKSLLEPDLSTADYLDDKHDALKKINASIRKTKDTIAEVWAGSPSPPPPRRSFRSTPTNHSPYQTRSSVLPTRNLESDPLAAGPSQDPTASTYSPLASEDTMSPEGDSSRYEDSVGSGDDSYANQAHSASIEEVSARGRGTYKCPHGKSCKKGGLRKDGRIRIFALNSEYK
ncbi:putative C2H2-type domain-containing protein [Seiridium cardinale]|uniref:C2H2-type domain-containing protein n=1 Tax=Seiridium cardinale TaxID=138064 RepID=A0ABR2XGN0_9PEZI